MTTEPENRSATAPGVRTVALADARAELSKLVTLAEHAGQITAITRYGRPVAAVVPAALLHLLAGGNIGPQPIEAGEIDRIENRVNAAERKPSGDAIQAALDDIREEVPERDLLLTAYAAGRRMLADKPTPTRVLQPHNAAAPEPGAFLEFWQLLHVPVADVLESSVGRSVAEKLRATQGRNVTLGEALAAWSAEHAREAAE